MKQAKVLNDKDIKIIKAVINDNRYAIRNMTMFLLALNCGLRAKEIASIKVKDVLNADHKINENTVLKKEDKDGSSESHLLLSVSPKTTQSIL